MLMVFEGFRKLGLELIYEKIRGDSIGSTFYSISAQGGICLISLCWEGCQDKCPAENGPASDSNILEVPASDRLISIGAHQLGKSQKLSRLRFSLWRLLSEVADGDGHLFRLAESLPGSKRQQLISLAGKPKMIPHDDIKHIVIKKLIQESLFTKRGQGFPPGLQW